MIYYPFMLYATTINIMASAPPADTVIATAAKVSRPILQWVLRESLFTDGPFYGFHWCRLRLDAVLLFSFLNCVVSSTFFSVQISSKAQFISGSNPHHPLLFFFYVPSLLGH